MNSLIEIAAYAIIFVIFGIGIWQAYQGTPDRMIPDSPGVADPKKVSQAKRMIRAGKLVSITIPLLFILGFWRMIRDPDWKWLLPFFAALAATAVLILVGQSRFYRYSKGTTETPDPQVTALLRSVVEYDRPLWKRESSRRRQQLDSLLAKLVDIYIGSDEAVRAAIRNFFRGRLSYSGNLCRIAAGATRQISEDGDLASMEENVRRALNVVAIFYEFGDFRDALGVLHPLYRQAKERGVEIEGIFRDVAVHSYQAFEQFIDGFLSNDALRA